MALVPNSKFSAPVAELYSNLYVVNILGLPLNEHGAVDLSDPLLVATLKVQNVVSLQCSPVCKGATYATFKHEQQAHTVTIELQDLQITSGDFVRGSSGLRPKHWVKPEGFNRPVSNIWRVFMKPEFDPFAECFDPNELFPPPSMPIFRPPEPTPPSAQSLAPAYGPPPPPLPASSAPPLATSVLVGPTTPYETTMPAAPPSASANSSVGTAAGFTPSFAIGPPRSAQPTRQLVIAPIAGHALGAQTTRPAPRLNRAIAEGDGRSSLPLGATDTGNSVGSLGERSEGNKDLREDGEIIEVEESQQGRSEEGKSEERKAEQEGRGEVHPAPVEELAKATPPLLRLGARTSAVLDPYDDPSPWKHDRFTSSDGTPAPSTSHSHSHDHHPKHSERHHRHRSPSPSPHRHSSSHRQRSHRSRDYSPTRRRRDSRSRSPPRRRSPSRDRSASPRRDSRPHYYPARSATPPLPYDDPAPSPRPPPPPQSSKQPPSRPDFFNPPAPIPQPTIPYERGNVCLRCGQYGHFLEKCTTEGDFPTVLAESASAGAKPMLRFADERRWPGKMFCFYDNSMKSRCNRSVGAEMEGVVPDIKSCCRNLHLCPLCGDPENDGHWWGLHVRGVPENHSLSGLIKAEIQRRADLSHVR